MIYLSPLRFFGLGGLSMLRMENAWGWVLLAVAVCVGFGCRPAGSEDLAPAGRPDSLPLLEVEPQDHWRSDLQLDEVWMGDLDAIAQRGRLRVLTTYSTTNYFLEGGRPRGLTYELVEEFVKSLNEKLDLRSRPISAVFIPMSRDRLIPELAAGRGDLAAAHLTATQARAGQVDFGTPLVTGVKEVLVTGPGAPPLERLEDLSGVEVFVRPSSSYRESLETLNARLRGQGLAPTVVQGADENLEVEDILELLNAGSVTVTVVDDYLAAFWSDVFDGIRVHEDLVLRDDGEIGWALRKGTPKLAAEVDAFARAHRKGTLFGNVILKRYLRQNPWVKNMRAARELERLRETMDLFQRYAARYDFDWLLLAAQAYQESGLDQSLVSPAGAVGVMQLLPSTAAGREVGIADIWELENNIHAGVKYLRVLVDRYFDDPGLDDLNRHLFAFAGYNAGPNRIQRLRKEADELGLDSDQWFENVEVVVARRVGGEPVRYVSNIFKYYVAYSLEQETSERRRERKQAIGASDS